MKITVCKGRLEFLLQPQDRDKSGAELFREAMTAVRTWLLM